MKGTISGPSLRSEASQLGGLPDGISMCRVQGSVTNYAVSALIGSIRILVANWSRTLWPRPAVTVALVAVQLITGSIIMLARRAALTRAG